MLWQVTSDRMMTQVEEIGQDEQLNRRWQYPPRDVIVQEVSRIWAEGTFTLNDYNFSDEEPDKLIDCYKCLEVLAQQREYLDVPVLPDVQYDANGTRRASRLSDEEVDDYARRLVPLVLETYRSMVHENFPTLAAGFRLYKNQPAFTIAQVTTNGTWISIKYAFIKEEGILNTHFGSLYVSRGQGLLRAKVGHDLWSNQVSGHDLEIITVPLNGITYEGLADIYDVRSNSTLTLQDHVYELIRCDLNDALRKMKFHAF